MTAEGRRTGLAVAVPDEADSILAPWRGRYLAESVERGIPAHLTILVPFARASEVTSTLHLSLGELYASLPAFDYDLTEIRTFPDCAWLAPEPSAPFDELIAAIRARFPDYPPYGDSEVEPVPHCTVGVTDDAETLGLMVEELEAGLANALPLRCRASEVTLWRELDEGRWVADAVYALGS